MALRFKATQAGTLRSFFRQYTMEAMASKMAKRPPQRVICSWLMGQSQVSILKYLSKYTAYIIFQDGLLPQQDGLLNSVQHLSGGLHS